MNIKLLLIIGSLLNLFSAFGSCNIPEDHKGFIKTFNTVEGQVISRLEIKKTYFWTSNNPFHYLLDSIELKNGDIVRPEQIEDIKFKLPKYFKEKNKNGYPILIDLGKINLNKEGQSKMGGCSGGG